MTARERTRINDLCPGVSGGQERDRSNVEKALKVVRQYNRSPGDSQG